MVGCLDTDSVPSPLRAAAPRSPSVTGVAHTTGTGRRPAAPPSRRLRGNRPV